MAFNFPTVDEFKNYFVRDFPFGTDPQSKVIDGDVSRAIADCQGSVNQELFSAQGPFTSATMLLAAHYLVSNIRMSSQGFAGGAGFAFLEVSKSIGSISASYAIPQRLLDEPFLAMLASTSYGARYLQIILPLMYGSISCVGGTTQP